MPIRNEHIVPFFLNDSPVGANALNSAPYIQEFEFFKSEFSCSTHRLKLMGKLDNFISEVTVGYQPICMLVGGSILDKSNIAPKDIDCILLVKPREIDFSINHNQALLAYRNKWCVDGLDLRIISTESPAILQIKLFCFFSVLYSQDRNTNSANGVYLVEFVAA